MPISSDFRSKETSTYAPFVERETLLLALFIYSGWLTVTYFHKWIPTPLLPIAGGWILAWQGSLQHETIHGHPTQSKTLNFLIGCPPLSLWLPYRRYRATHIAHHRSENLTKPSADPESRYLARRAGPLRTTLVQWNSTLFGRLLLGPAIEIVSFLGGEFAVLAHGDKSRWKIWGVHGLHVTLIIVWLIQVCHLSLFLYIASFIYPGAAFALLRSFAEHRAAEQPGHRVAIVENAPVLGLLFLNNNLHAVHHQYPGAPWFKLPTIYRQRRSALLKDNGGLVYAGYADVFRRFLFSPHDALFHPTTVGTVEAER